MQFKTNNCLEIVKINTNLTDSGSGVKVTKVNPGLRES